MRIDPGQRKSSGEVALAVNQQTVGQIETRALLKLRQPQRRSKVKDYILGLDS